MEQLENIVSCIYKLIWSWPFVIFLFSTHIFLTIKLKFPQIKIFTLFEKNKIKNNSNNNVNNKANKNSISSFAGLMTILGATIGMGNIVGVAEAIKSAGKGVIFWICISGFFAIATKYAETYIVLKYRKIKKDGKYVGGAMYVLDNRLGHKKLAQMFAVFTILASFGVGAMIQSNSLANLLYESIGVPKIIAGITITIVALYIILGGEKRLSKLSKVIIPITAIVFVISNIAIIIISNCNIMQLIKEIFIDAFNLETMATGVGLYAFLHMLNVGLGTGLFSNESGMGSSPIFTATVDSDDIIKESTIASISTTIDTVILCTLTGFALIAGGVNYTDISATMFVKETFALIPYIGEPLLNISIVIFVISCIPCFEFYAKSACNYLFDNKNGYTIIYSFCYLLAIFIGANMALAIVWNLSGIANALMVIPNVIMILLLVKEIKV